MHNCLKCYYTLFTNGYKYIESGNWYNYIPTNQSIQEVFDPFIFNEIKILDVGSGLGEFMLYLKMHYLYESKININVSGIEIDEHIRNYVKISTTFIDAFEFIDYGNYDLIYLYQPIKNVELMIQLLKYISNFKVQIIYNNADILGHQLTNMNFIKLKSNIWHYK